MKEFLSNWWSWTCGFLGNHRGDVGQMFTPPKSKSPWEAMTQGSTGGWAAWAGNRKPKNPNDPAGWGWVGPALTIASGATGYGLPIGAAMGAMGTMEDWLPGTGYQGSDYGWGNVMPMLGGALAGAGAGMLGQGATAGLQAMMSPTATVGSGMGFGGGASMLSAAGGPATGASAFAQGFGGSIAGQLAPFGGLLAAGTKTGAAAGATGGAAAGGAGTAAGISALANPLLTAGIGGGMMAISQMGTTPAPPNIGDVASKWLTSDAVTKAGKIAQGIAQEEIMGDFNVSKELQGFMKASEGEITKAYKTRRTQLDSMGQAANPQWKNSGERLEMHRRLNEEEQRETDLMKSQWMLAAKQQHAQQRYGYVIQQINVDEQVKRELLYADMSNILWKYQIERDDLLAFREIARDAGLYLFEQGVSGMA